MDKPQAAPKPNLSRWELLQQHLRQVLTSQDGSSMTGAASTLRELSPTEILGYTPTPEQLRWTDWAFSEDPHVPKASRKLFLGARGYGKSDLILVYGITRALLRDPSQTFLIMSRTHESSRNIVKIIGENLKKAGVLAEFSQNSLQISGACRKNPKQPTLMALSVHGRTKGHHADYLFIDDPLDPLDIYMSRVQRRVRKVYDEAFNIAKNVVVIGQYIGVGDLYTQIENQVDTLRAWHGTLPFLDVSREEFLKTGTLREWGCNYGGFVLQDAHSPFADLLVLECSAREGSPREGSAHRARGSVFAFLDVALGGGDDTALSIGWRFEDRVVVAGFLFSESYTRALPKILNLLDQYGVQRAYYESNGIGDALYLASGKRLKEERNTDPKVARISRLEGPISEGRLVFHPDGQSAYLEQIRHYHPFGTGHDDAPDSLASLWKIMELFGHP